MNTNEILKKIEAALLETRKVKNTLTRLDLVNSIDVAYTIRIDQIQKLVFIANLQLAIYVSKNYDAYYIHGYDTDLNGLKLKVSVATLITDNSISFVAKNIELLLDILDKNHV